MFKRRKDKEEEEAPAELASATPSYGGQPDVGGMSSKPHRATYSTLTINPKYALMISNRDNWRRLLWAERALSVAIACNNVARIR